MISIRNLTFFVILLHVQLISVQSWEQNYITNWLYAEEYHSILFDCLEEKDEDLTYEIVTSDHLLHESRLFSTKVAFTEL